MMDKRNEQYMSPEKRGAISKLREQELALDKQSIAIETVLSRLDASFVHHKNTTGSSLYRSLYMLDRDNMDTSLMEYPEQRNVPSPRLRQLYSRFNDHVAATNNFQLPSVQPIAARSYSIDRKSSLQLDSIDDNESFIGVDVLKHSQHQLARIREQRASTLAQRLQQKQDALVAAEYARLNALHEIRHRAAIEIAVRHFAHKQGWAVIKYLYNAVKLKSNYRLAEFKWRVVSLLSVLHKLVRYVHINASSDAPYVALRTRDGWRKLCMRIAASEHIRVFEMQGELLADSFRESRCCRRVLRELYSSLRRKAMTNAIIDVFRHTAGCKRTFRIMRETLQSERYVRLESLRKLQNLDNKRKLKALRKFALCARRGKRSWSIIMRDLTDQANGFFHALRDFARQSVHISMCNADASQHHRGRVLSNALLCWRSSATLRAHRKYCHDLASAHVSDISGKTGSEWLRYRIRECLFTWHSRVQFSRRRALPVQHFKSKRNRQQVRTLFKAWSLSVATTRIKRSSDRNKIHRLQLLRGWAYYQERRREWRDRLMQQKDLLIKPSSAFRSKLLALGFSDFRMFSMRCKAKRLVVCKEKQAKKLAYFASFISNLQRRFSVTCKTNAAIRCRLKCMSHQGLLRWQQRAQLKIGAKSMAMKKKVRCEYIQKGWGAWSLFAQRCSNSELLMSAARRSLRIERKRSALKDWVDWTEATAQAEERYSRGKGWCIRNRLVAAMRVWTLRTSMALDLGKKGVHAVPISAARVNSFFKRWMGFLNEGKLKRAQVRRYGVNRNAHLMAVSLSQLRGAVLRRKEESSVVKEWRVEIQVPLLQARFIKKLRMQVWEAAERRSDPCLQHFANRSCRESFQAWKVFRRIRMTRARSERLGERNRVIVSGLRALAQWRFITELHGSMVESARQAARQYRRRYFAPAFKNWLRNTASLAHQFDARYLKHGNLFKKTHARRLLATFKRCFLLRRKEKVDRVLAVASFSRTRLRRGLNSLCTSAMRTRQRAARKGLANKLRALSLKRKSMRGLIVNLHQMRREKALLKTAAVRKSVRVKERVFAVFKTILRDSETPNYGRACRYFNKIGLRAAFTQFRKRVLAVKQIRLHIAKYRRRCHIKGLMAFKIYRRRKVTCKARGRGTKSHFSKMLLMRFLQRWLCNRFALKSFAPSIFAAARLRTMSDVSSVTGVAAAHSLGSPNLSRQPSFTLLDATVPPPVTASGGSPAAAVSRRPSFAVISPSRAPISRGLSRTSSRGLVRRRSSVNPLSFLLRRRLSAVFEQFKDFTAASVQERDMVDNAVRVMDQYRQQSFISVWRGWLQDVVGEKLQVLYSDLHKDRQLCTQVFPVLRTIVRQGHHVQGAHLHHLHALATLGWRRWTDYACTNLRKIRAKARALQRRQEKEKGREKSSAVIPQFVDDDFSHRRDSFEEVFTYSAVGTAVLGAEAAASAAVEVKDFRVTVQRRQWVHADVLHLVHAASHGLARWKHWFHTQHHHRKLMYACIHRQVETVFKRLCDHMYRAKHNRETARSCRMWRRNYLLRHSFAMIKQHQQLSTAIRRLALVQTGRIFQSWKSKRVTRARARDHLSVLEEVHRSKMLQKAFTEWAIDTAVESNLLHGLELLRTHRLHHGIDHLIFHCKTRRRKAALLLRSRRFKTNRLLHLVFTNILLEMSKRYRNIEVMRDCGLYHQRYRCRQVVYNLFYLRRNRIAKDHCIGRKFRLIVSALRLNKAVTRYAKSTIAKANIVVKRKVLWMLFKKAKQRKAHVRRLRVMYSQHGWIANRGTTLADWVKQNCLHRCLKQFRLGLALQRVSKRRTKWGMMNGVRGKVYHCFRRLLSHARRRNLKRRNSTALYRIFLNLQLRRAVSRLDVNVSNKWAQQQEMRLMHAHSVVQAQARVLGRFGKHALEQSSEALLREIPEQEFDFVPQSRMLEESGESKADHDLKALLLFHGDDDEDVSVSC